MKKSSFVAMILGTTAGILFSLGMCMALLPEWNAFVPGVVFGGCGLVIGLITILVWRKMEKKPAIKISGRGFKIGAMAVIGALLLGIGMSFCMVWENIVVGTLIGLVGILLLLSIIPVVKGIK